MEINLETRIRLLNALNNAEVNVQYLLDKEESERIIEIFNRELIEINDLKKILGMLLAKEASEVEEIKSIELKMLNAARDNIEYSLIEDVLNDPEMYQIYIEEWDIITYFIGDNKYHNRSHYD